jgi:hypothetical protein
MKLDIGFEDLTLGELEEFEDISGVGIEVFGSDNKTPVKALTTLVYLAQRRNDPTFTLEAARALKLSEVEFPKAGKKAAS